MRKMCRVLRVNESGYYHWRRKGKSRREIEDARIIKELIKAFEDSKKSYGAKRLQRELRKVGIEAGISRISRLMRENGIYSKRRGKKRNNMKRHGDERYVSNLLSREFDVSRPNETWAGDITYIKTKSGWVYLAIVMDLYNREIIGYATSKKPNTELVMVAMAGALNYRKPEKKLMFHSDRGVQYSSKRYQDYLEKHSVEGSMSRKGNPYDNALVESFFATLKKEWVSQRDYKGEKDLGISLNEYIDMFYNNKRQHSKLGNMSPREYYRMQMLNNSLNKGIV